MKKGEVTAFLSLIFILVISFVGGVMDSASIQVSRNYRRADATRAMECIFAEYQKELLKEYEIFALDAGYESGDFSENLVYSRLEYYGLVNCDNKIERIQFLSDDYGKAFYEQVSRYMEHKYGLGYVEDALGMTDQWKEQEEISKDFEREESKNKEDIEGLLKEYETEMPGDDNPILHVEGLKRLSVLNLVMPEGREVSQKQIPLSELPSHRTLNRGYGEFQDEKNTSGTVRKLLFDEYIMEHFHTALDGPGHVLDYEVEYVLAGKSSDKENLKSVVNKLLAIRFVSNYAYLQKSAEKKEEARVLALTISSIAAIPAATEAITQGILLAWAFGESIVDIRSLLNGNKVPMNKNGSSWQLSLSGLLELGEKGDIHDGADDTNGLAYEEYLKMLLFLEEKEILAERCLDMLEQKLRKTFGLDFFRVDLCITRLGIKSKCYFRKGITYTFPVYFAYQ